MKKYMGQSFHHDTVRNVYCTVRRTFRPLSTWLGKLNVPRLTKKNKQIGISRLRKCVLLLSVSSFESFRRFFSQTIIVSSRGHLGYSCCFPEISGNCPHFWRNSCKKETQERKGIFYLADMKNGRNFFEIALIC